MYSDYRPRSLSSPPDVCMQKTKMTSQASMRRKTTTNWISATGEEFSPATLRLVKLGDGGKGEDPI